MAEIIERSPSPEESRLQRELDAAQSKLDSVRHLVERDGYQAKNGGNGGRQFLEALQETLK